MATEDQLIQGLKAADAAGNTADAQHFADQIKALRASASAPDAPKPGILERAKNAIIAPEAERDASLGDAVKAGITGIPAAIGHDFMESARSFGRHIAPSNIQEFADAQPLGGLIPKEALDVGGMIMSPITGALTSAIGRPVEQQTGLRREITGNILSAAVPLGGEANLANDAAKVERATAALKPMAAEAHAAGYVLPPKMISDKPGIVANTLAGWSGKVKTAQAASAKNQEITNSLAAKALDLPEGADLTGATFKDLRAEAGKAYAAIPSAIPQITADEDYLAAVSSLGRPGSEAAQRIFPNTTKNQGIIDLQDELSSVKDFPTGAGIELVKELRSQASKNLKAFDDPSKSALGSAQKRAANAIDELIDRNLAATGQTDLVQAYRDARVKIAKSYDVEAATNTATGNVNAQKIARLADKDKPLSGELETIAKVAKAFPKATQSAEKFGEVEPVSILDLAGSAASLAHGNPSVAGALLGRPIARAAVLSKPVQNALAVQSARGATAIPTNVLRRAPAANAFHQLGEQPQN
jgi:hypothetical protein